MNPRKKLEQIKAQKRVLDIEYAMAKARSAELKQEANRIWKGFGISPEPSHFGEYTYGLVLKAMLLTEADENNNKKCREMAEDRLSEYFYADGNHDPFMSGWRTAGYARVNVGHKLTSVLMLTSVPDEIKVVAPWGHWLLEIPDGLYPFRFSRNALVKAQKDSTGYRTMNLEAHPDDEDAVPAQIKGLFCEGTIAKQVLFEVNGKFFTTHLNHPQGLIENFVKGTCLSFDDRKHVKETSWARSPKHRQSGSPGYGHLYTLSQPVTVDFREEVKQMLADPKRRIHTAQWLVRGHWRNQRCGLQNKEIKRIRIEPYWKGPAEARILLRGHNLV